MRKRCNLLVLLLLLFVYAAFGQQRSVVIIDTDRSNGYGVAWGGPDLIVTPLHVVAGQENILVRWGNKSSRATVEKIYKPADLALLRLETSMGLPPMELFPSDPFFGVNLDYWEVVAGPALVRLPPPVRRNTILEERTPLKDINTLLARRNAPFDKTLCKDEAADFFPQLVTPVFKFAEPNIGKKHSGAPITSGNQIIGMVDGGAKRIAGRDLVWAIPASEFNNLMNNGVAASSALTSCDSDALFSGLRSDNPLLSDELRARALELENADSIEYTDNQGNDLVFTLAFRGTYAELFYTMFEEDQQYILDLIQMDSGVDKPVSISEIYRERCDILVEENTGTTIAYPTGASWETFSADNGNFIEISSPEDGISMIVQVGRFDSLQQSVDAVNEFKEYLLSDDRNWVTVKGDNQERLNFLNEEYPSYYETWIREVRNGEETEAEILAMVEIDGSDFLGVAVVVESWEQIEGNRNERKFFYLMEACALLTGFVFH